MATLLLTCATVASKRSLFVFTPLVFGVAYNVIDFFLIYHLYAFFFGSSRVRFHIFLRRQRTWPFELKVWFNSPIFAMFKTSSCQESKKKQKRGKRKKLAECRLIQTSLRASISPDSFPALFDTWVCFQRGNKMSAPSTPRGRKRSRASPPRMYFTMI